MQFDQSFIDELLSRLRASEVIGRHVELKRAGREFRGLSPFNSEKTPSFFVNDEKGMFFDFSAGKAGNVITFLQQTQNLTFKEVIEQLAGEVGMKLPEFDPEQAQQYKRRKELSHWTQAACHWFRKQLHQESGEFAREYLRSRGLDDGLWPEFSLGFAPQEGDALLQHLHKMGASDEELLEAGLAARSQGQAQLMSRFRNRLMFPIENEKDLVVAFGGRALSPNARAKYLNSPDCTLFHKGRQLYRFSKARDLARETRSEHLFIAEGYLDVIAFERSGLAAVSALGTAITDDQLNLIWRTGVKPVFCFDGDGAGQRAAARTAEKLLPHLKPGREVGFMQLPKGQDPDDVFRANGADALRELTRGRQASIFDLLWTQEYSAANLDNPDQLGALHYRLKQFGNKIKDVDMQQAYQRAFTQKLEAVTGYSAQRSHPRAERYERENRNRENKKRGQSAYHNATWQLRRQVEKLPVTTDLWSARPKDQFAELILGSLFLQPQLLEQFDETVAQLEFEQPQFETMRRQLLAWWFGRDSEHRSGYAEDEEWKAFIRLDFVAEAMNAARMHWQITDQMAKQEAPAISGNRFAKLLERMSHFVALRVEREELMGAIRRGELTEKLESRLKSIEQEMRQFSSE